MALLQVPSHGSSVAPSKYCMDMDAWLAVRPHRDIANQGSDFDLLLDGDGRYFFVSQSKNASLALLNAPIAVTCAPPSAL